MLFKSSKFRIWYLPISEIGLDYITVYTNTVTVTVNYFQNFFRKKVPNPL